jgi:Bacterial dnaA  protein
VELDGRHQFGSIVVGQANRLAVAAALAVAENPGTTYNPLYIWSAPGLGKTQLLTAIGLRALALEPALQVAALTADEFEHERHLAVSMGDADAFHRRYKDANLLLIDDVQFLTGRHEAQAELLRLCDELHASGRQIACAGDRPPGDIAGIDERLAAQLSGGLVVEIGLNGRASRASDAVSTPRAAEFLNFISDVATVVARHVEPWRSSIGEAAERWAAEGYDTAVLARAMRAGADPGSDALIATYERCVARLRTLQCEAAGIDPELAAMDIFFDPARVAEAEARVAVAQVAGAPVAGAPVAGAPVAGAPVAGAQGAAPDRADAGAAVDPDIDGWQNRNHDAAQSNGVGDVGDAGDGSDTIELVDIVEVVDAGGTIQTDAGDPDEPLPVSVVARRTSRGMVITSIVAEDPFFLDDEKVVWDWPDALGRVIEEFR